MVFESIGRSIVVGFIVIESSVIESIVIESIVIESIVKTSVLKTPVDVLHFVIDVSFKTCEMLELLTTLLQDTTVVTFSIKNEAVIKEYFDVPYGESPRVHILKLSNNIRISGTSSGFSTLSRYRASSVYCSTTQACTFCQEKLFMKKIVQVSIYDDILGSRKAAVLTRYCRSCKVTYYPGFSENYVTKVRVFDDAIDKYGIFMSTYSTAFSLDFLERSVCLKLKCHTTFLGREAAYNLQQRYNKDDVKKVDKRVLADAFYKFTLFCFKKRYLMPLTMNIDVSSTLNDALTQLQDAFTARAASYQCSIEGCKTFIVVAGHMKAHRKICLKNGCIEDPKYQSKYCDEHSKDVPLRKVVGEQQVLTNKDEFHRSEVLRRVTKKKKLYEMKWKGYEETTLEPCENIPRVLIELFEKHGDSSITTTIKNHFDKSGIQYVTLGFEGHEDTTGMFIADRQKCFFDPNTQRDWK